MNNNRSDQVMPTTSQANREGGFLAVLRVMAFIASVIGGAGSLIFMFSEGQNTPRFLLVLFTIWILSPFAALLWANTVSKRWSTITRGTLYVATLIIGLSSLAIYSEWIDIKPAGSANAFLFVAVPPVSLLFLALVVSVAAFISGRLPRSSAGK